MHETNRVFTAFPFMIAPDTSPPDVADDALTFPTNGARLLSEVAGNVTWSAAKITDAVNGTSCVITWINACDAGTTQPVAQIAGNVNNTAGLAAWTPPANLESNLSCVVCALAGSISAATTHAGAVAVPQGLPTNGTRAAIAAWCAAQPAGNINAALHALTPQQRRQLINCALDTTAAPVERQRLFEAATLIADNPLRGFYLELFATTQIRVHDAPGGGYAAGDHISLGRSLFGQQDITVLRNTITHEFFHIFNHQQHAAGGISGLNEGTAIWIFKCAYNDLPRAEYDLGLAEPTFYFAGLQRDQAFDLWLGEFRRAHARMLHARAAPPAQTPGKPAR